MSANSIWSVLGIEPTPDVVAIRRAYAAVLKRTNPDDDPAGFARLRQAYEQALVQARIVAAAAAQRGAQRAAVTEAPTSQPREAAASEAGAARAPEAPSATPGVVPLSAAEASSATPETAPSRAPEALRPTPPGAEVSHVALSAPTPGPMVAPRSTPPPPIPPAVDQLRNAFLALKQAVTATPPADPPTLQALLAACLNSSALQTLSVQLEFEPVVVQFLLQTLPVTQCLLETVIERWKWRERLRTRSGPGIAALLAHAENLRVIEQLRVASPRVHRSITQPPRPFWLWLEIVFLNLHQSVRQALGHFRSVSPGLFDPKALQWWTRFMTAPHIRPGMIRLTLVFTVIGIVDVSLEASDHTHLLRLSALGALIGCLAGLVPTLLWWGLIDWPRHKLRAVRQGSSRLWRFGWAPACLAALFLAALCPPDSAPFMYVALLVGFGILTWALVMAPGLSESKVTAPLRRLGGLLVVNLPLLVWWLVSSDAAPILPTMAMSIIFGVSLLAFAITQPLLWSEFLHDLRVEGRQWARVGVIVLALAGLALAWVTNPGMLGGRLLFAYLIAVVLVHRTPVCNLSIDQAKGRYYIGMVGGLFLVPLLRGENASLLRAGGVAFMAGVVASAAFCLHNDWRAVRRQAPTLA